MGLHDIRFGMGAIESRRCLITSSLLVEIWYPSGPLCQSPQYTNCRGELTTRGLPFAWLVAATGDSVSWQNGVQEISRPGHVIRRGLAVRQSRRAKATGVP